MIFLSVQDYLDGCNEATAAMQVLLDEGKT